MLAFYSCLRWISLADATSIWFAAPILTGIFASIFLSEPFTTFEWSCGLLSMFGVLLVTQPDVFSLFGSSSNSNDSDAGTGKYEHRAIGYIQAILAVLASSMAFVVIRHVGTKAHALFSVYYFSCCTAVVAAGLIVFSPNQRLEWEMVDGQVVVMVGLVGLIIFHRTVTLGAMQDVQC